MDIDKEREKIGKFIKAGLLGLSIVLLVGCSVMYLPKIVTVFQEEKPKENLPINSVDCNDKKLALSFDVSGSNDKIDNILEVLESLGIKATFFMTGDWIDEHADEVRVIYRKGHDIGNRSLRNKRMTDLSQEECKQEIQSVHKKVKDLTGQDMNLFRAPYGEFNETIMKAAEELGYYPIGETVDSMDWKDYGVAPLVNKVCNHEKLKEGAIILCHTNTKFTKDALSKIVKTLQKEGYTFEKVSKLIYSYNYFIDETGRQTRKI